MKSFTRQSATTILSTLALLALCTGRITAENLRGGDGGAEEATQQVVVVTEQLPEASIAAAVEQQQVPQAADVVVSPPSSPEAQEVVESNESISYEDNFANVWEPYDRSRDVPFFWQIPKAGTTNALAYLSTCMDVVKSTRVGAHFAEHKELKVVEFEGHKYMNVDTSTIQGMRRAKELSLEKSPLVDIVTSGFVYQIPKELFTSEHRGRMFALFRDPIERLVSIFYYLQTATWEPTYHPDFADMTIEQYVKSEFFEGNWMVRMITNKMKGPVTQDDLLKAKKFLSTKCIVGLQNEMNESLDRFQRYFGWELKDSMRNGNLLTGEVCKERFFHPEKAGGLKMNTNKHPKILPGSDEYNLLLEGSKLDMELYEYAIELFADQAVLVQ